MLQTKIMNAQRVIPQKSPWSLSIFVKKKDSIFFV
jgi:hypothetical protein